MPPKNVKAVKMLEKLDEKQSYETSSYCLENLDRKLRRKP